MDLIRKIKNLFSWRRQEEAQYPFAMLFSKFQSVLATNNQALELIADMGDKLGGDYVFDRQYILSAYQKLSELINKLVYDLNTLAPKKYVELFNAYERIHKSVQDEIAGKWILPQGDAVIPYKSLSQDLHEEVGNKNANLAEIRNVLELSTPDGFAVTTGAFQAFLDWNGLYDEIQNLLESWDEESDESTAAVGKAIQECILSAAVPPDVIRQIVSSIEGLRNNHRAEELFFAVRSSAWGEDSEHSFAGQYKSFLNVPPGQLIDSYKAVLASAYSSSALVYRQQKGFRIHELAMAAGCQLMINARASGVLYTLDPASPDNETMIVSATWGLGAPLVDGEIQADHYVLSRTPPHSLNAIKVVRKPTMLVSKKSGGVEISEVPDEIQSKSCLTPQQLQKLGEMALLIERYFKRPQDIEWALDQDSNLIILQARLLNIKAQAALPVADIADVTAKYPVLMEGSGVVAQRGVATGKVYVVEQTEDIENLPYGCILVTKHTSPRLAKVMRKVHGIITDVGSPTGHMATIAREFRVPTIVNTRVATQILKTGDEITLDATQNIVYEGKVKELRYFEFTEEDVFEESYEYRLLRRILRKISPLHLVDPHDNNFKPEGCRTLHDIIRFAHEKAVEELIDIGHLRLRSADKTARRLKFDIPLGLIVIDVGGGMEPQNGRREVVPKEITSIPMQALLRGMTKPGMWGTEPVPVDFASFMSSLTQTAATPLAAPRYVGQNLAVVSREYLDLSMRLGYHFNIIDAYISDNLNDNYAYFRFLGGVSDMIRRSRRARFIAEVLERFNFLIEIRGDLVVARIKKLERAKMEEKMCLLGCLVAYTRQLDIKMHSDALLDQYVEDFIQRTITLDGQDSCPTGRTLHESRTEDPGFNLG